MSEMLTNKEAEKRCREFFASELERIAGIKISTWIGETSINKAIGDFRHFHERGFWGGIALALSAVAEGRIDLDTLKAEVAKKDNEAKD